MDGNTPIDVFEPQFTQREASDISGADMKSINNWLDRGHIALTEIDDRRLVGRRFFSVTDIAVIHTLNFLTKLIDCPPAAAVEVAEVVGAFMDGMGMERPTTPEGKHYKIWHICKRSVTGAPPHLEYGPWTFQGIWQHPDSGAFYHHNPGVYPGERFTGFPHFPCIMLPTSQLAARVFLRCADQLGSEYGLPEGRFSQGIDD